MNNTIKMKNKDLLDLITRKQSEIERLKKSNEMFADIGKMYSEIRTEAVKEFAERFAKELSEFDMSSVGLPDYDRGYEDCMTAIEYTIDNLVKEMTEYANG